jgi:hypothetical protein
MASKPMNEAKPCKLPRLTTFGRATKPGVSPDFYRAAAPFMTTVNRVLDAVLLALVVGPVIGVAWLGFIANLNQAYVSDGVHACRAVPMVLSEDAKAKLNATGTPARR